MLRYDSWLVFSLVDELMEVLVFTVLFLWVGWASAFFFFYVACVRTFYTA